MAEIHWLVTCPQRGICASLIVTFPMAALARDFTSAFLACEAKTGVAQSVCNAHKTNSLWELDATWDETDCVNDSDCDWRPTQGSKTATEYHALKINVKAIRNSWIITPCF